MASVHTIAPQLSPGADAAHLQTDTGESPLPPPTRNKRYFIEDEMTVFLVENQLFKIHRHFLKAESEVFRTMFDIPTAQDQAYEGKSESNPINLPGVTVYEFESLLDYFYQSSMNYSKDGPKFTAKKWEAILSISHRFAFDTVRKRCIEKLSPHKQDPIERVLFAWRYDIHDWLVQGFEAICQRSRPLTIEEAEKIGLPTATRLAQAREEALTEGHPHVYGQRYNLTKIPKDIITRIVKKTFWPGAGEQAAVGSAAPV